MNSDPSTFKSSILLKIPISKSMNMIRSKSFLKTLFNEAIDSFKSFSRCNLAIRGSIALSIAIKTGFKNPTNDMQAFRAPTRTTPPK